MMATLLIILLLATSISYSQTGPASTIDRTNIPQPYIQAAKAVLIDADTGEVIWGKNADRVNITMSTTKIITAAVILRSAVKSSKHYNQKKYPKGLNTVVKITKKAARQWGSSMGIWEGEKYTVRELLYGMMMQSGNDAAKALAIYHSGTYANFAKAMRNVAEKEMNIKTTSSTFSLPYMKAKLSAKSLAKASRYLLYKAPGHMEMRTIVKTKKKTIYAHSKGGEKHHKLVVQNTNAMLKGNTYEYEGIMGLKTGTDNGYGEFVGAASRVIDGKRINLIAVVLASDYSRRFIDTKYLFNYGFGLKKTGYKEGDIKRIHPAICIASAGSHKPVIDPAVKATCTKNGKTAGAHCQNCGKPLMPRYVIPAYNHKTWSGKKIVVRRTREREDSFNSKTNTYTVRNREYTFTGNEQWFVGETSPDGILTNKVFSVKKSDIPGLSNVTSGKGYLVYCNYYVGISDTYHTAVMMNHSHMYVGKSCINFEKPAGQSLYEFKRWVKKMYEEGTPLKIVYPIKEKVYKYNPVSTLEDRQKVDEETGKVTNYKHCTRCGKDIYQ